MLSRKKTTTYYYSSYFPGEYSSYAEYSSSYSYQAPYSSPPYPYSTTTSVTGASAPQTGVSGVLPTSALGPTGTGRFVPPPTMIPVPHEEAVCPDGEHKAG